MNAQMALTAVTLMPHVKTFLETSPASVTKDTVEMDLSVMVHGLAGGPFIITSYVL